MSVEATRSPKSAPAPVGADAVTATSGVAVVGGVYADGWAHVNVDGLETFFTPWHLWLYSSFTVLSLWAAALVWHRWSRGTSPTPLVPPGYGLGLIGIAAFALGGLLDMLWHLAFGIEAGIDALVSPTHLVLLAGGALLLSSAARSDRFRNSGGPAGWTAVISIASVTSLGSFFLSYVSVFVEPGAVTAVTTIPEGAPGHQAAELLSAAGLGGYLMTTMVLVVPLLLIYRLGGTRPGTTTVLTAAVALPGAALTDFRYIWPAVASVVAALLLDVGFRAWRWPSRTIAMSVPPAVLGAQLVGLASTGDLAWPVSLWTGVIGLAAMMGYTLSLLLDA